MKICIKTHIYPHYKLWSLRVPQAFGGVNPVNYGGVCVSAQELLTYTGKTPTFTFYNLEQNNKYIYIYVHIYLQ